MLFLSYRRNDSLESTDRIREWLEDRLPPGSVFMDTFTVPGAVDWRQFVEENISKSQAMLVIIGPNWAGSHLFSPDNAVRFEIEVAYRYHIPIIPILTLHAKMPNADQVPSSLVMLTRQNALRLRAGPDYSGDIEHLRRTIEQVAKIKIQVRHLSNKDRLYKVLALRVGKQIQEGLRSSLHDLALIELGLQQQPGAISPPYRRVNPENEHQLYPLQVGATLISIFDNQQSLLILGKPGAGKTSLLLQLGEKLLERVQNDEEKKTSLPLYLNLSMWTKSSMNLSNWLVESLRREYQFTVDQSNQIIETIPLILLLDGLDEVAEDQRSFCIEAINDYLSIGLFETPIVVCSRIREYIEQPKQLNVVDALQVQPLLTSQIDLFLKQGGDQLIGIQQALQVNQGLEELAHSPLWLNLMAVTYREMPAKALPQGVQLDQLQRQIFARYVEKQLDPRWREKRDAREQENKGILQKKRISQIYQVEHANRWLIWLATFMQRQSLTRFYLESLEPSMVKYPKIVKITPIVVLVLLYSIVVGFIGIAIGGSVFGIIGGSFVSIVGGLFSKLGTIELSNHLKFSWRNSFKGFIVGFIGGNLIAFTSSFFAVHNGILIIGLFSGIIVGFVGGIINVLFSNSQATLKYDRFQWKIIRKRSNQIGVEISNERAIGIDIGLVVGLMLEIVLWRHINVFLAGLAYGIGTVLIVGLIPYGKHWILRLLLWSEGDIPYLYATFLHYVSDRNILRQVGNGWEFVHPLLRDYFASLSSNAQIFRKK